MKLLTKTTILGASAVCLLASQASAVQLLTNGDFETGTFAGWSKVVAAGSSGNIFIDTPGTTTPTSAHTTSGTAANGSFYAVTDQTGPGSYALLQSFTVGGGSSVLLSFDMFANDYDGGPIFGAGGLSHTGGANQHARVDILTSGAGAFDTGATVLGNFFLGVDAGPDPHGFTHYSFDISGLVGAGGTFQLRFAEVDNSGFFNLGVDNASIQATSSVPDGGSTLALLGLSLAGVAGLRRKLGI